MQHHQINPAPNQRKTCHEAHKESDGSFGKELFRLSQSGCIVKMGTIYDLIRQDGHKVSKKVEGEAHYVGANGKR